MTTIRRFGNHVVATAFGRAMKEARTEHRITQEALAERADLDGSYPSLLERGQRTPGLPVVIAIGEAIGVGGDVLVRRTIELLREDQQHR